MFMDKDRGTDCRGGAARHSAAWLPVIRTSCSLLFQAICVLSARIPAGADELCFKKNVPVRSRLREVLVRALLLPSGMPVSVSLPSVSPFQVLSSPHPACPAVPAVFCLDRELSATAFAQATDGDTPPYAGKCSVGFSAPAAEADGRCGG